jgi:uncharacterized protein
MTELPRLSQRPFPPYRHVPGETPHPSRDPRGYAHGAHPTDLPSLMTTSWRDSQDYLYAVDLYNHGYWWECHEALEGLWHAAGHRSAAGQCLQAVIQCAVAHLKTETGNGVGARKLLAHAEGHVAEAGQCTLGLDLMELLSQTHAFVHHRLSTPAKLRPDFSL